MFQQRPMPPMNSRGFFPQQGQIPMGRQPMTGTFMGRGQQLGSQMATRGAGGGGLKGLLSRIMPGSQGAAGGINPQNLIGGANAASNATRGSLQGLMNPSNISGMLGNVQKVLGMAQQVTPMVQQYGPLVKNLPAMLKIYRELNSSNDDDNDSSNDTTQAATVTEDPIESTNQKVSKRVTKKESSKKSNESENIQQPATETRKRKPSPRSSQPKMYI